MTVRDRVQSTPGPDVCNCCERPIAGPPSQRWWGAADVARRLGYRDVGTVRARLRAGAFPGAVRDPQWRIPEPAVLAYLRARDEAAEASPLRASIRAQLYRKSLKGRARVQLRGVNDLV